MVIWVLAKCENFAQLTTRERAYCVQRCEHRRLPEIVVTRSADEHLGAPLLRLIEQSFNTFCRTAINERSNICRFIKRIADL